MARWQCNVYLLSYSYLKLKVRGDETAQRPKLKLRTVYKFMKYKTTYNKCFIINAMCKKHIHKEIKVHFLNANQKLIIPNNSRNFPSKRLKFEEQNIFTIQKVSKQNSCSGNAYFRLLYFFFNLFLFQYESHRKWNCI